MSYNKRAEGQLWIDRQAPHGLKYVSGGKTYQLEPTETYKASEAIPAGAVVAVKSVNTTGTVTFKKAEFPKDLENVVGICPKSVSANDDVSFLRSGTIVLSGNDLNIVSQTGDLKNTSNLYVGAPVYWFIGRSYKDNGTWKYLEPSLNPGAITLATPSGMRWGLTSSDSIDPSLNVGYGNLPTIGTVSNCVVSGGIITSLEIVINFSRFESSLDWHWPYSLLNTDDAPEPQENITGGKRLVIRHGLFCVPQKEGLLYYAFKPRCFCNIVALDKNTDDENVVMAGVDNYYGVDETEPASKDKRTEIDFKGYDGKRVYVMGKVVYTFAKQPY